MIPACLFIVISAMCKSCRVSGRIRSVNWPSQPLFPLKSNGRSVEIVKIVAAEM